MGMCVLVLLALVCCVAGLVISPTDESLKMKAEEVLMPHMQVLYDAHIASQEEALEPDSVVAFDIDLLKRFSNAATHVANHLGAKPFVIVSQQRSGTGLLVSKLGSHPDIACFGEYFNKRRGGSLRAAFRDLFKNVRKDHPNGVKWFGFKLMENQMKRVNGLFAGIIVPQPVFIQHWRKNVLRQVISNQANLHDIAHPRLNDHRSHATTQEDADMLAAWKPTIDHSIFAEIARQLDGRARVAQAIEEAKVPTCQDSSFEEWVSNEAEASKKLFDCFGVEAAELHTHQLPIHMGRRVLDTVQNPEETKELLTGSEYEYMLNM